MFAVAIFDKIKNILKERGSATMPCGCLFNYYPDKSNSVGYDDGIEIRECEKHNGGQ